MIYLFSGLGADERVFAYLDFGRHPTQVIRWETPLPTDTLKQYAHRIAATQITHPTDAVFIGVSFGGIVAIEVARFIQPTKVILISSVKKPGELPWYYRLAGRLRFDRLVPARWLAFSTPLTYFLFGVTAPDEKALLATILQNTDPVFLKWAIRQILQWRTVQKIENLVHIHGDNDRILPYKSIKNAICVTNGGHFMVVSQADQVSRIVKRCLNELRL